MPKYNRDDECSYEEMSHGIGGQSMPSEYYNEHDPYINSYENSRKSHYGEEGIDWSGMEKHHGR